MTWLVTQSVRMTEQVGLQRWCQTNHACTKEDPGEIVHTGSLVLTADSWMKINQRVPSDSDVPWIVSEAREVLEDTDSIQNKKLSKNPGPSGPGFFFEPFLNVFVPDKKQTSDEIDADGK